MASGETSHDEATGYPKHASAAWPINATIGAATQNWRAASLASSCAVCEHQKAVTVRERASARLADEIERSSDDIRDSCRGKRQRINRAAVAIG